MQRCGEFRDSKEDKKTKRTRQSPKRRSRVRFGWWRGWERLGTAKTRRGNPARNASHSHTTHAKRKPAKTHVSAGFAAGTEGLGHACCPGCRSPMGSAQHWPRREPRPARQSATGARAPLGKRFWGGCGNSLQGVGKCRCWPVPPQVRKGAGCGRRPSQRAHNPSFLPIQEGHAWGAEIAGNLFHLLPCVAGVNQSFASEHTSPVGGLFFQCTRGTILSKS